MKQIVFFSALIGFVILSGCYFHKENELYPTKVDDSTVVLTYNGEIKTLMSANCAISSCHVAGGRFPDLSNYASLKTNITRVTKRAITDKNMPAPNGMSATNITNLDNWIKAGMKEQ